MLSKPFTIDCSDIRTLPLIDRHILNPQIYYSLYLWDCVQMLGERYTCVTSVFVDISDLLSHQINGISSLDVK